MKKVAPSSLLALGVVLALGCGGASPDDAGSADAGREDAGLPVADAGELDGGAPGCAGSVDPIVCSGTVDPVSLGTGIEEVLSGLTGDQPGLHWFCEPGAGTPWNGRVLFYLVGTYGDPAREHAMAARACELGFVAIAPMYENRGLRVCGDDGPCHEGFVMEIVDGGDHAPDPVVVDADDSIRNRASTLALHLAARGEPWSTVAARFMADDWSSVALAGHSQGSTHATYLAREESAERLILLAGPSARLGSGTPTHSPVPWIAALETTPLRTPLRFAYIHDDDSFQIVEQVLDNWDLMGVPAASCSHASAGGYPATCRRIRVASDGCTGLNAHLTPVLSSWGADCRAGALHDNRASWDHLLLSE